VWNLADRIDEDISGRPSRRLRDRGIYLRGQFIDLFLGGQPCRKQPRPLADAVDRLSFAGRCRCWRSRLTPSRVITRASGPIDSRPHFDSMTLLQGSN
jgi:hypothetical protein